MSQLTHRLPLVLFAAGLMGSALAPGAAVAACVDAGQKLADPGTFDGARISSIEVDITGTLDVDALRRNLRLGEGDLFDSQVWQSDVQQLLNQGLFDHIETHTAATADGVCVHLDVETNWTLLPFLGLQTGAVPIGILGINNANFIGQLVEAGAYYMRRGPHNLGRAWLVLPNVVAMDTLLDIELVMTGELMLDFPSPPGIGDGIEPEYRNPERYRWTVPRSGQEVLRRGIFVDLGYRAIPNWLTLSLRYLLLFESSYDLPNVRRVLHDEFRGNEAPELQRGPADRTRLSMFELTTSVGHIDLIANYRYTGHELSLMLLGAMSELGSQRELAWAYVTSRHFFRLSRDFDLAARVAFAHTTSNDRRDHFNLGGYNLEPFVFNKRTPGVMTVRGYGESSFSGPNLTFANVEPRYDLVHDFDIPLAGKLSLTLTAYVDVGSVWQRGDRAFDDIVVSAGGGVLLSLQEFRYTFINWYYAHTFRPLRDDVFSIVVTRPFF